MHGVELIGQQLRKDLKDMPKYNYHCSCCNETYEVFHLMDEEVLFCEKCKQKDCLERLPTFTYIKTKPTQEEKRKVGELTKEYIENVKELVKEQKKELEKLEIEK